MKTTEQIIEHLPGTVHGLVGATGKSETTVRKALKELEAAGIVSKSSDGLFTGVKAKKAESTKEGGIQGRPGRPKDPEVQARDTKVLELIKKAGEAGLDRAGVAKALGVTTEIAYLSIWRLKRERLITKVLTGTRSPAYRAVS